MLHARQDDIFLLQFLRARKFDVKKACQLLEEFLRLQSEAQRILRWPQTFPIEKRHRVEQHNVSAQQITVRIACSNMPSWSNDARKCLLQFPLSETCGPKFCFHGIFFSMSLLSFPRKFGVIPVDRLSYREVTKYHEIN